MLLPVLLSLACPGLFLVQRTSAHVGHHGKPSLSAWPSPVVPQGSHVHLHCVSDDKSATFKLYKEHGPYIPEIQDRIFQKNITLGPVTTAHGGIYRCYNPNLHPATELSSHSDPLQIIISGVYRKPSLSALPAPVVKSGEKVTLWCRSEIPFPTFILMLHRQGVHDDSTYLDGETHHGGSQASISIGPVTPAHAGTYICFSSLSNDSYEWSDPSDPVDITITGLYRKPSLSALPAPVVKSGGKVTLRCGSEIPFPTFILMLHRQGVHDDSTYLDGETHHGGSQASISIGPVTPAHAGTYICFASPSNYSYEWSDPSDPVDITITGLYKKPSLAAHLGPVVMSGQNVTLSCSSDHRFDMFHLLRDGVPQGYGLPAVHDHHGTFQANFPLSSVIQAEPYRCYGSFNHSPHEWSDPSDPLHLPVTDSVLQRDTAQKGVCVGLAVVILVILVVILGEAWHSQHRSPDS